ncbi:MAG: DUF169 domain-containing protein [Euryarchaeota archaeon]|nr:DUF169 domain-containing protein [Euryarchaeota archaeon]MDE1879760.1 DUF169 domain-containing protein [Euryarchaeota archaeon]MDE2044726.1 DUF169 domain-containing protein [Thermoplasmata archaeon]
MVPRTGVAMNFPRISKELTRDLELDSPPVHLSYLEHAPAGAREHLGGAPSACTFWAEARQGSFFAPLSEHEGCEIGAFVLGIPPEGDVGKRLMGTIGMFEKIDYVGKGEASGIPHHAKAPRFVHYGPLAEAVQTPTVAVLFPNPANAMVALEAASPGHAHPFDVPVTGRPACSVIPIVLQGKAPVAMSLGCAGFRQYTEVGKDKVLIAVRGGHLEDFAAGVHKLRSANEMVSAEMAHRKAEAASGALPGKI